MHSSSSSGHIDVSKAIIEVVKLTSQSPICSATNALLQNKMVQAHHVLITICVFSVCTVVLRTVSIKQFWRLFEIARLALDKEWCGGKIANNRNREPEKWRTSGLAASKKKCLMAKFRVGGSSEIGQWVTPLFWTCTGCTKLWTSYRITLYMWMGQVRFYVRKDCGKFWRFVGSSRVGGMIE